MKIFIDNRMMLRPLKTTKGLIKLLSESKSRNIVIIGKCLSHTVHNKILNIKENS